MTAYRPLPRIQRSDREQRALARVRSRARRALAEHRAIKVRIGYYSNPSAKAERFETMTLRRERYGEKMRQAEAELVELIQREPWLL